MIKKCQNNKGLSLVEVVMSALVVAILMAGLYAVYISAKNMTSLAFHKVVALAWAASYIEGQKNGVPASSYTDPSAENTLKDDKSGNLVPASPPESLGKAMIKYSASVNWTE